MARLILENEDLKRELGLNSEKKKKSQKENRKCDVLDLDLMKRKIKYYTGFDNERYNMVKKLFIPDPNDPPLRYSRKTNAVKCLSLDDQLLLVLVKLKHDFDFIHIGHLFGVSNNAAGLLFTDWINYMYFHGSSVSIWPHRDIFKETMPVKFKEDFPNVVVTLDGTEIKVQKPSSLAAQSQLYSDYKSCTTLKGLVGVDPRGSVTFISTLYSGAASDKQMTKECGLLKTIKQLIVNGYIKEGDAVMVDKGFDIKSEIESLGLQLLIPPTAPSESQLSPGACSLTRKKAKHRVHVERAISRIKKFKIVSGKVNFNLYKNINQIWFICCLLTNFMPYLIKK